MEHVRTSWAAASIRPTAPTTATDDFWQFFRRAFPRCCLLGQQALPSGVHTCRARRPRPWSSGWAGPGRQRQFHRLQRQPPRTPSTPPAAPPASAPSTTSTARGIGPGATTVSSISTATPGIGSIPAKRHHHGCLRTAAARSPRSVPPTQGNGAPALHVFQGRATAYSGSFNTRRRSWTPSATRLRASGSSGQYLGQPAVVPVALPRAGRPLRSHHQQAGRSTPTAPITARTRWTTSPTSPRAASWRATCRKTGVRDQVVRCQVIGKGGGR